MRRFAIAALCVLMMPPAVALAQDDSPRMTVTGEGQAAAVPDMATVTLGVTAQNEEPGAAMEEANQVAAAILARLDTLGIAPRDRQTSDIGLQPVWNDYGQGRGREIEGYEASNRLTVRVRDLDQLGEVLGAVTEDGANRLSGLTFGLQEPDPVMDEARRDAVADAMSRAQVLAEAAGVTLGPVLSISEAGGGYAPAPMMEMARVSAAPVAAGESVLNARVSVVFALGE
ncbi:SIMPL domain-containing protein [Salipiger abyssi]|uniref:SIMPL domain-containing protein n=1 Tax=Salipiger abyssi TaxID=1250539 RepID=UPI001A8D6C80|nr:SIMPL domain-containing protein [Salipiger abyssi]MBN9888496.1 SIMPL domain-containing protein [Salipiger abyssi]